MASLHTLTYLILISTNLHLFGASSSNNHGYHDFVECLIDQFQRLNSATDTIYTPQNATYATLLLSQNSARPQPFRGGPTSSSPHSTCQKSKPPSTAPTSSASRSESRAAADYEASPTPPRRPLCDHRHEKLPIGFNRREGEASAWRSSATLGQLYYAISRTSRTLAFPAGVCPTVGVGGHFSGGGYSMISRKHSIAADHIVDATLINADGQILNKKAWERICSGQSEAAEGPASDRVRFHGDASHRARTSRLQRDTNAGGKRDGASR
ncbi:berberine bridge enzyme-like 18 [Salvia hispanica]|uniref:berberine bridge enzyme-like 18 n=1 Tax=Salvia hispanica TaxID=49212 RepID=UPI002009125A|nr:berberine bridge enzyme-like 18 [Salvia hispanica]